ncbi:phage repressor protein [Streptococcus oralis subsp. oralis]|uniref:XRE family transcriptional regulator n=1 Tax=Streptococcus oralis TaxID=1303 RepID=UPI000A10897E|nr:S24 family peptidase [Streptococcus oralis]ORO56456.1 phage repressor protein [Streptococcus oralis subsp. oralis]
MDEKKRMKIIAENITHFRKQRGITQKELAKEVGITASTMTDYMKLRSAPSFGVIQKLADYFGVKKSDIDTTFKEESSSLPDTPDSLTQQITNKVVQLTTPNKKIVLRTSEELLEAQNGEGNEERFEYHVFEKLSAGTGYGYTEDRNYDTVYFDKDIAHDLASWVYGDSMEPKFVDGSVALIRDTGWDYDGAIYAVDWDGQTYIKKVYSEPDGLRLVSLNPKYKDRFAPYDEDPRIIGKIIGNFMPLSN